MRVFLLHTHTHAHACTHAHSLVTSQWGHKHTNNISKTALRVTSWAFDRFIWVKLSSYHIHTNVKVFAATRQNKSVFYFYQITFIVTSPSTCALVTEVGYETLLRTLQQKYLFNRMYILLLKLWKLNFLRNGHTFLTCFNFNSKFPLFAKKSLIVNNFKIDEIDVSCLHLITRYTTQNFWGKIKHFIRLF